jgi:hypothetical protein
MPKRKSSDALKAAPSLDDEFTAVQWTAIRNKCPGNPCEIQEAARQLIGLAAFVLRHPEEFLPANPAQEKRRRAAWKRVAERLCDLLELVRQAGDGQNALITGFHVEFDHDPGWEAMMSKPELPKLKGEGEREAMTAVRLLVCLARNARALSGPFLAGRADFENVAEARHPQLLGLWLLIKAWHRMGGNISCGYDAVAGAPSGPLIRFLRTTTDIIQGKAPIPAATLRYAVRRAKKHMKHMVEVAPDSL